MVAGRPYPLALSDVDGPDVEVEPWASLRSSVYVLARDIFSLEVASAMDRIELSGTVASEKVKGLLGGLFREVARELLNVIEVTAPFSPAADEDSDLCRVAPVSRNDESVMRHPSIIPHTDARPGEPFSFEVDLPIAPAPDTDGPAVELKDLPAGWSDIRVGVVVVCDEIEFKGDAGPKGYVTVFRTGASNPARFDAWVKPDVAPGSSFLLRVLFNQENRHAGSAARTIVVDAPVAPVRSQVPATARASTGIGVSLGREIISPTLNVTIVADTNPGSYHWVMGVAPGVQCAAPNWQGKVSLGPDTREFARRLLRECPNLRPGRRHASVMKGIGEEIWEATPSAFKAVYIDLYSRLGRDFPIQIITDEPHVPWEMMHPKADAGIDNPDHLYMTHPMARWFGHVRGLMPQTYSGGALASFVPEYADGSALPAAAKEGRRLIDELGARPHTATHEGFTSFWSDPLPEETISVIHFAGHAASPLDDGPGSEEGLRMLDDWVSSREVHGGVTLGKRDRTFVVLNACSAGTSAQSLGVIGGWPANLASQSFGGVLAPIWAVQDEHASSLVLHQLAAFIEGVSLGQTLQAARNEYREASATPYAYLCHGDVMARMGRAAGRGQV